MSETPATSAATAPAEAPAAPAPAAPAAPAADSSWTSAYQGEDLGWLQNRGYDKLDAKSAVDALFKQTRQLESYRGVPADRLLTLPQDMTAEGALDPIYERLGRPEKPEDYGFKPAEDGSDADYVKWSQEFSHSLGLNKKQAEKFDSALRQLVTEREAADTQKYGEESAAAIQKLKDEWKDSYALNEQIALATAQKLAVSDEELDGLEAALGSSAAVIRLFHRIGAKTGEAQFHSGNNIGVNGATTPEGAQAEIARLTKDPAFGEKYLSGDGEAVAKIQRLSRIAAGESPVAV